MPYPTDLYSVLLLICMKVNYDKSNEKINNLFFKLIRIGLGA